MKLAKVSLAAVVALGTLSTASMAKDLSEAIKGVDVSGFLRYRYTDVSSKNENFVDGNDVAGSNQNDGKNPGGVLPTNGGAETTHAWKAVANFTIPTSETFSAVMGVEYNNTQNTGASSSAKLNRGSVVVQGAGNNANQEGIAVRQFYGAWNPNGTKTTVHIGKFNLATPATDPGYDRGTGILALNSDVENVTFAAAALDTWYVDDLFALTGGEDNRQNNLYAAAAIASFGGFSGQLWAFNIEDMVDALIVAQLGFEYDMFGIEGQYFNNSLDTNANGDLGAKGKGPTFPNNLVKDNYELWTIQASIDWNILGATAGYLGSGDNGYFVQLTDQATFINYGGEQWYGDGFGASGLGNTTPVIGNGFGSMSADNGGKNELEVWWLTAMVDTTWNNISVGADYVQTENNTVLGTGLQEVNFDGEEWVGRVNWKASDAWNVKTYYSNFTNKAKANVKPANYGDVEMDKFRVEARYNF
jgi:hypothetical protein